MGPFPLLTVAIRTVGFVAKELTSGLLGKEKLEGFMTNIENSIAYQELKNDLLIRAIDGEGWAVNSVLSFLGSPNPQTCNATANKGNRPTDSTQGS